MRDPRICRRSFPFGEHRDMAAVIETETLQRLYRLRLINGEGKKRLNTLLSRATEPDHDPPSSVA